MQNVFHLRIFNLKPFTGGVEPHTGCVDFTSDSMVLRLSSGSVNHFETGFSTSLCPVIWKSNGMVESMCRVRSGEV